MAKKVTQVAVFPVGRPPGGTVSLPSTSLLTKHKSPNVNFTPGLLVCFECYELSVSFFLIEHTLRGNTLTRAFWVKR